MQTRRPYPQPRPHWPYWLAALTFSLALPAGCVTPGKAEGNRNYHTISWSIPF